MHQYVVEQKQVKILMVFTILTIFIACLGLFGVVTFTRAQRTKGMGIRKVLGVSVSVQAVKAAIANPVKSLRTE